MATILKWLGNKTPLVGVIANTLPPGKRLVEPFVGSCSLVASGAVHYESYLFADSNVDVITMYQQVRENPEGVLDELRELYRHNNRADYNDIRLRFNTHIVSPVERAAMFIYLNRHGFRGLCRYNNEGGFNVSYGEYKTVYFPEAEIRALATNPAKMEFKHQPWETTLGEVTEGDVVYCDPPYVPVSDTSNFTRYTKDGFSWDDQLNLAEALNELDTRRIGFSISNSATVEAIKLYSPFASVLIVEAKRKIRVGQSLRLNEIIAFNRTAYNDYG